MIRDWDELERACLHCTACGLSRTRKNVVFGAGSPRAGILLVGEGPGRNEDEQGVPFVGRSGRLMDLMLRYVGLSREENIYITNIVKCRPPDNRDPGPEEIAVCMGYLRNQVALARPKIIVCVGRIAAMNLIGSDYRVTADHGRWIEKDGVWMTGTFHPAALLRNPNNKPAAMEDFFAVRDKAVGLGILPSSAR